MALVGFSETALPRTAELLESADSCAAVMHAAGRRDVDKYASLLDFFLCEILHEHKPKCRAYYRGTGESIDWLLNEEQLAEVDAKLVAAVSVAVVRHKNGAAQNWTAFRAEVLRS
jgi:hypothetical protein